MKHKDEIKDLFETVLDQHEGDKQDNFRKFKPVSPRDFFSLAFYSGYGNNDIYEFWVDEATDFIEGGYEELVITGSLGSGKTTGANLISAYKIYELFSWNSPHKFLGIPSIQEIYNIYFSVSRTQAQMTGFSQLRAIFDNSSWFKQKALRDKRIDSVLRFLNGKFNVFSGSSHSHALGMTVWMFILDEADFFKRGSSVFDENYEQITEMYEELIARRISRFKSHGEDRSFSILISSASYQSSFVDQRIAAAATDPKIKVINAVGYKVKPKGTYSEKKFIVFVGGETVDPCLIETNGDLGLIFTKLKSDWKVDPNMSLKSNLSLVPPDLKIFFEEVPVDFKKEFLLNIHRALMNHAGVFTARVGKLFQNKKILLDAYSDKLIHPFSKHRIELSTGDKIRMSHYFLSNLLKHIDRPHAIHVDQSVSGDSTGVSMVRYDGIVKEGSVIRRMYTQVFTIEVVPPPPPDQIKISKVRDFIIYLANDLGVNLVRVSYDQYQSKDSLQILEFDAEIPAAYQSIDKSDGCYLAWMSLLLDGCMKHYKHDLLEKETFQAVYDRARRKVDHPSKGSIDVLQSLVGALYNLVVMDLDAHENVYTLPQKPMAAKQEGKIALKTGHRQSNNIFKDISDANKKKRFMDTILG